MRRTALAVLLLAIPFSSLFAQDKPAQTSPKLPFYAWNVCPGEGCHWGIWTARSTTPVYDSWRGQHQIATLKSGDRVAGITGVNVTVKPGVLRIDSNLPAQGLKSGDTVLTYTYYGEGEADIWYHGRLHSRFDISFARWPDGTGCTNSCSATYLSLGRQVWWSKVKLPSGQVGWIDMTDAKLDGVCALAD